MSSLFLVLTVASLPFIIIAERPALKRLGAAPFTVLGIAIVVGLTALRVGTTALGKVSFSLLSPLSLLYIFLAGAVAITAMVLPGISGSSILLIAGVYLPAVQSVKAFLGLDFSVLPGLLALGFGVIAGVGLSIHGIREALRKRRSQMVWLNTRPYARFDLRDSKRPCRTEHAAAAAGSCFIPDPGVPAGHCDTART